MSTTSTSLMQVPVPQPRCATLQEWLDWQVRLHFTSIELGLDRCRRVAERMQLLDPEFVVVSIAGTNGKGSSAAMLDQALRRGGYRTGRYTSPHLVRYNERICVNGIEVEDADLCRSFQRIDEARGDISLTFFEFGTLAAIDIFRRAGIELAVMEVGLGGRLDAVNVLDADIALLTTIDFDHEDWLGHDRDSIGREKSGIFRRGRAAVCADPDPPASVLQAAADSGARLLCLGRDFHCREAADSWSWSCAGQEFRDMPWPYIRHDRHARNAAGVLCVLHELATRFPVPEAAVRAALAEFRLPGRLHTLPGEVSYVLDVAHNPQAAAVLAANLARLPCAGATHVVIGMLRDKNHAAVLQALSGAVDHWYLSSLDGERGAAAAQLAAALPAGRAAAGSHDTVAGALAAATAAAVPGDRIVVTGSFVTVGAALQLLNVKY